MLKDVKLTIMGSLIKSLCLVLPEIRNLKLSSLIVIGLTVITKLSRTSSAWWKSNTMNDYEDMTRSSLHTRSNKYMIYLIHVKSWVHGR
jgi:hypothetical protein